MVQESLHMVAMAEDIVSCKLSLSIRRYHIDKRHINIHTSEEHHI